MRVLGKVLPRLKLYSETKHEFWVWWGLSEFWGLNWEEAKEALGVGRTSKLAKL